MARVNTTTIEGIQAASAKTTKTKAQKLQEQIAANEAAIKQVQGAGATFDVLAGVAKQQISDLGKTPEPQAQVIGTIDGVAYTDENAYATAYAAKQRSIDAATERTSAAAVAESQKQREQKAARAELEAWLGTFFDPATDAKMITQLMSFVDGQITEDIPPEAIMLNIRTQPFYQQRFSANAELAKKGLAELTPDEYLRAERSYSSILRTSGLGDLAQRTTFNALIGGEVSATELQDRITNVYDRINNADTALQSQLGQFFNMGLSKADLAKALLTGTEGANQLKRKVAMAEIGAEFAPRGLTSALGLEELANLGVTREQAQRGAEYTREGTKRLTALAGVYGQTTQGLQSELEAEAFKGLESQRRKSLTGMERAAFSGAAGTGTPSLGRSQAGAI